MAGHPPRGRPPTIPAARSPHRACKPRRQCWAPTPAHLRPQHVGSGPDSPPGGRAVRRGGPRRPSQRRTAPPGDALLPPPQRATPARKGARCGAGPGSPRPRQPHPGHTGRGIPVARPRGWAAGEGQSLTPDTPHKGDRPIPPGAAPHHPRGAQPPQGMQAKGTVLGPHTRTPAPTARG